MPADTFANRLRILRHDLDISAIQLSEMTGFSHASISNWERGARPHKLLEVVERIAEVTGIDRDWLLWGWAAWGSNPEPTGSYLKALVA